MASVVAGWEEPYFLVSMGENKPLPELKTITTLTLWGKTPEAQADGWSLKRVENVPDAEEYRSFEPDDQIQLGTLDLYTEHFLVLDSTARGAALKGKIRITDLDQGTFLATRGMAWDAVELAKVWRAAENRLAHKKANQLFLLTPGTQDLSPYGYSRALSLLAQGKF